MSDATRDVEQATPSGAGAATDGRVHPFEPPFGEVGDGPDELRAAGKIGETVPQGLYLELLNLVGALKVRRESMGLSLTDVSERSGLTRQAVSKLENGHNVNPTLETLYRYAMALDAGVTLGFEQIEVEDD
jgi:DNA-binding XRE family transcriptional regulator